MLVREGSGDIAVGVSGFGSAKMSPSVWLPLAVLTGRTTYVLRYDAQELPWSDEDVPQTLMDLAGKGPELVRRWSVARIAAAGVSEVLAEWIRRWIDAGRRVLIVGFSLGGYVSWRAVRDISGDGLEVILLSAAIGDTPAYWRGVEGIGRLVNVYSREDLVLRRLYPLVVTSDETPAAGLGPLSVSDEVDTVENVDATDLIRHDHLWASMHLERLVRMALGCLWAGERNDTGDCIIPGTSSSEIPLFLPDEVTARLLRWCLADPSLWLVLGRAMEGDPLSVARCLSMDSWSCSRGRMVVLLSLGRTAQVLFRSSEGRVPARRAYRELSGTLRMWMKPDLQRRGGLLSGEPGAPGVAAGPALIGAEVEDWKGSP